VSNWVDKYREVAELWAILPLVPGNVSVDKLGKIKPLSTDIETAVGKPEDTKKLSTELSTYQQVVEYKKSGH
jgi:hypothetical protein